jgi:serine/threonine protein phosphatase 1
MPESRSRMWQRFKKVQVKYRAPEGVRIYAIGDVHGRSDLLSVLFQEIDRDLEKRPSPRALHVFLGDYIDRGPRSKDVISLILSRRRKHEVVALKGNHDIFPGLFLKDPEVFEDWRQFGGVETLISYGLRPSLRMDKDDLRQLADDFAATFPVAHADFLNSLSPSFSCGDFFFVHAGVKPGTPLDQQCEDDLLWIREEFLDHGGDFGKLVVHGHTPVKSVDDRGNRINIDTGAYATGCLSALVIDGAVVRLLDTSTTT